jgi:UDP-glucose:(heptosyl)LPS alpha-1,3-glucosyltransferase
MNTLALIRQEYSASGGAEIFIKNFVKLMKEVFEITLIHGGAEWPVPAATKQIALTYSGYTRTARKSRFFESVNCFLSANRFDIVQAHERVPGANIYRLGDGVHAAWLSNLRMEGSGARTQLRKIDPFHRFMLSSEKAVFSQSHSTFVAISELVKSDILKHYNVPEKQIITISNGVDTGHFRTPSLYETRAARDLLKVPLESPVICFVGSDFKRKGLLPLLLAIKELPDYYLIVAGHDKSISSFIKEAVKQKISNRVRFLGPVDDIRPVYWASDLFVLPSLYDPFSNAALEAAACGLPAALTKTTGFSFELIDQSAAGLEITRNQESIQLAIERLYSARAVFRQKAVQVALKKDFEHTRTQWEDLYRHFL